MVRVARGRYLPSALLNNRKPWEVRQLIAQARLHASNDGQVAFTGESALVALGVEPWFNNPDVWVRKPRTSGGVPRAESVKSSEGAVNEVRVRQITAPPRFQDMQTTIANGLPIVPMGVVVYDLARTLHSLQAFHDVSTFLRRLAQFDRWDLPNSRSRELRYKEIIYAELAGIGPARGAAAARTTLEIADAGIETPAESIVVWSARCILDPGVKVATQFPLSAGGRQFFIDLALPDQMIAIEISGYGKFGGDSATARQVATRFARRQQAITDSGWRFINVFYEHTQDIATLSYYLRERFSVFGVAVRRDTSPAWQPATVELFSKDRRF